MSKSLGNFYTLRDLLELGHTPESIRYLLVAAPYRKKLNFTFDGLRAAQKSIERIRDFELRITATPLPPGRNEALAARSAEAIREFEEGMDDDLNTAQAVAAVFEYVRALNGALDENQLQEENRWDAARVLEVFDGVFDVLKPSEPAGSAVSGLTDSDVDALVEERNQAKKARDFKRSDEIRNGLLEQGVVLEDTKDGVRWKRK
jgi:cysteinyl-tRNA synthetase